MQEFKQIINSDRECTTRQSSKRTVLSRVATAELRSLTPLMNSELNFSRRLALPRKMTVKIEKRSEDSRFCRSEPPYVLMRNGVPFLYTPADACNYRPDVISPFGSNLRGSKIQGRYEKGNMFALHYGTSTEKNTQILPRSCLNMRSKWK